MYFVAFCQHINHKVQSAGSKASFSSAKLQIQDAAQSAEVDSRDDDAVYDIPSVGNSREPFFSSTYTNIHHSCSFNPTLARAPNKGYLGTENMTTQRRPAACLIMGANISRIPRRPATNSARSHSETVRADVRNAEFCYSDGHMGLVI